jgi:glyoxylase-like metal-dependent hydrolase (beta-lactamase superfamily II)
MAQHIHLTEHAPGIYLAERSLGGGDEGDISVRALLLLGEALSIVLDTLVCPSDMRPFAALIRQRGRPLVVVNSHADWDHAWGNAAFPGALIVGQRHCRERLLGAEERATLQQKRAAQPQLFADVELVAPQIGFESRLDLHAGSFSVELHHLPGHSADSLVAYLPERGLLFAADCAEWPIPLLGSGPALPWAAALRRWAALDGLHTVIPAHGPLSGPELLLANAGYLEQLANNPERPWQLPAGADPWYLTGAHPENVRVAKRQGDAV